MRKIFFCALCALALVSCKKNVVPEGKVEYCVTGDYTNVTENSVTITCTSVTDKLFNVGRRGVWYSTNPEVIRDQCSEYSLNEGLDKEKYTVTIEGLLPGTTYYYRAFIRIKHEFTSSSYYTGSVKSFTTLP